MLSLGDSVQTFNIGTSLWMRNDSICFYMYDIGYTKWKVVEKIRETITKLDSRNSKINALYLVKYDNLIAFVYIDSPYAEISILTDKIPITIKLYRK